VNGFIRYWGPQNGGINEKSSAAYRELLKVFLSSASLRWFFDTYLTVANIATLLGSGAPEITKLQIEWYCYRLMGCNQGNSSFPISVWMKKEAYWKDEDLDDGMFKTMADSMDMEPVLVEEFHETPLGPRTSSRKKVPIDLHCKKTNGCEFVTKHPKALKSHEKSCRAKVVAPPTDLFCAKQGCGFVTPKKALLTQHMKSCSPVVPPEPPLQMTQVFACPHGSCNMTHTSKKDSLTHQRTHTPNPPAQLKEKKATKKKNEKGQTDSPTNDPKLAAGTPPAKPLSEKRPFVATKLFQCPFTGCDKSHATADLAQHHQRKHCAPTPSLQGISSGMYRCPECVKSHASPELARLHQQKHRTRQLQPAMEREELVPYPECKVYRGTAKDVLAHIGACRAALTCPECNMKFDSQTQLIAHMFRCALGNTVSRKRRRDDDESWEPTRNRNKKTDVRLNWTKSHVRDWLKLVELADYTVPFEEEKVDGRILLQLTEEALKGASYKMKDTHVAKFLELRTAFD